ncbi:hypothetical protein P4U65_21480 [Bacillus pacificus]|nr:hypothetical protein [Bacillus thuringiensis]MED1303089.1 hypothetical protein [Bacillus pacificus]
MVFTALMAFTTVSGVFEIEQENFKQPINNKVLKQETIKPGG